MVFFDPNLQVWFLIILVFVGLLVFASIRWKKISKTIGKQTIIQSLVKRNRKYFYFKQILMILAVFFLVLALMRPRWGTKLISEKELGIDISLVIDISSSMNAVDILPSRLKRVVSEIEVLLNMLEGNRISLVLFAGASFIQCPLTSDISAIKLFLKSINTDMINMQGTNIEEALKKSLRVLTSKFKRNRQVLLFTDGESHEGKAIKIAEELFKKKQIRIFTIGVGTKKGSIFTKEDETDPTKGMEEYKKDDKGNYIKSYLDEDTLIKIAKNGGGEYFRIGRGSFDVASLAKKINNIEKSTLGNRKQESMIDRFQIFIFIGLMLLFFSFIIPERKIRNA